jgi:hypothetical protein
LKQGEKISNLEKCFAKSYSFTFDYLQKNFEKDLQKNLQKQKHVVQAWSNMLNKETIHAYLVSDILLAQLQATFGLTLCKLVQLCTSIFALVCVGINHQKGGD